VTRRKQWQKVVRSPSPPHLPRQPMLVDLVGLCFNCLWLNHVTAVCRHVQETSLNGRGWPPPCQQKPMSSIVINPVARNVALASPAPRMPDNKRPPAMPHHHGLSGSPLGSGMPSDVDQGSTPEGSPPPHSDLLGMPSRRPCFETRVIPCTTAIDVVEAGLANALVAFVGGGGTRLLLSPS
jgi:hypothetical protein